MNGSDFLIALLCLVLSYFIVFGFKDLIDIFIKFDSTIGQIECVEQEPNYNEIIDKYGLEKGLEIIEIIEGGN